MDIGQHLFIRGFLSIEWLYLLRHTHHNRPENVLTNIIGFLWHEFITPIWKVRNNILHRSKNLTTSAMEARLDDTLRWYLDNKNTALSRTDHFLIQYTSDDLHTITINAKKEWVRHLDQAKAAWDIERLQTQKGQTVLTKFFARMNTLTIGEGSVT
jgi:hypothetical protein